MVNGQVVGFIGELHPQWVQKYELPAAPVLFELDLDVVNQAQIPAYAEVSRLPPAIRDLAIVVDQNIALQQLLDGLKAHRPTIVQDIRLFDVYTGKGVAEGKKSLAFRIVMQDTQRTLQDAEVDAAIAEVIAILEQQFQARLRV